MLSPPLRFPMAKLSFYVDILVRDLKLTIYAHTLTKYSMGLAELSTVVRDTV